MLRSVSAVVFIQNLQMQFEGFSFARFWVGPGPSRGRAGVEPGVELGPKILPSRIQRNFVGVGRGRTQFTVESSVLAALAMSDQNPSKVRELIATAMH